VSTRKLLLLSAILLITISNSFAQDIVLSSEATKEYFSQKLAIEYTQIGVNSKIATIITPLRYERGWQAYKGNNKISEEDFLSITGFSVSADSLEDRNYRLATNYFGGFLLAGIGTVIFLVADEQKKEQALPMKIAGIGFTILALDLTLKTKINMSLNYVPASNAVEIANEYNHQLKLNISKNF
jgi:hypothetical protein